MPSFGRSVGIPFRVTGADIMPGVGRVVRRREVRVELSDVAAAVAVRIQDVADADCILTQAALRPLSHTVQRDSASLGIHSRQEDSPVGAAEGTVAHRP